MAEKDSKQFPIPQDDDSAQSAFQTIDVPSDKSSGSFKLTQASFGHYEIVGELGFGGMGIVYKAFDPNLKRFAALKLIRTDNPDHAMRFVHEARAQARVQHENVCRVYEVGEVDGKQYIAMQLIEGKSLYASSKEMSVESKIRVIQKIADALHAAHKQGLIHRDIKPSNIMLERTEDNEFKPYVLDFGLARDQEAPGLTRTGIAVGTPYYMAPEQVSGERTLIDRRTDVYGLGATLYELLSGKHPYEAKSSTEILLQILRDDPVPIRKAAPKIPQDLETIVMKCLERDPARRYDSSKALAEDLQRYLDGDPLTAKPVSWSYRLIKRAKKNRLATGIGIAAAVITIVLVSSFLWVQWQNKRQAEYAREFSDEVKNIQSVLPNIYTAPLHDVRPEITALRNRLKKMEERVKEGGSAAQDPGNNALGQGYLALGEIEKAREHLEKAWQAGYQTPSTAYALGQTMGLLFQKKLAEVERTPGDELRAQMKKQYEKEYRDPAVQYLKQAEGSVESPVYVEGLIALYEKRYDDALKKAKEAFAKTNWSYEAKTLEGKALVGLGQNKYDGGDYKGAIKQYELAGEAYAQAADLGRSRFDIYLSDCERWGDITDSRTYTDEDPVASMAKAETACNNAIKVNPDDPAAYLRKAYMYNRMARVRLYSAGGDPREILKKSVATANEAVRKAPHDWEPYHSLLTSGMLIGEYELRHGIDPKKSLDEAIRQGNMALSKRANTPGVLFNIGATYVLFGEYENGNGKNPVPTYTKAIDYYQRIEKIDKSMNVGNETGIAYWFIASYQMSHGEDPSESFRNSIVEYEKFLKEKPNDPFVLYNLGMVYIDQGELEVYLDKDPTNSIQQSLKMQMKASNFIPNNSYIANGIGFSHTRLGDYQSSIGKDPVNELNEARKFLQQSIQIDSSYYMPNTNLGYLETVNAQWAIKQGQFPLANYDAARKAYLKSIELNKEEPESYQSMAYVYRMQAEWELQQKRSAKDSIAKGFEWIDKALKMNKEDPDSIATQGALFLVKARSENNSDQNKRDAASAVELLQKAIKANSFLKKEYQPLLEQAKSIQAGA
jgi:eukaryotic-like serine/threonine-protein kinase